MQRQRLVVFLAEHGAHSGTVPKVHLAVVGIFVGFLHERIVVRKAHFHYVFKAHIFLRWLVDCRGNK